MKLENESENVDLLRTSRVTTLLGVLFIISGLGMLLRVFLSNHFKTMPSICFFVAAVAILFIVAGTLLANYRKVVRINREECRIDILESSFLGFKTSAIHFNEVTNVELSRESTGMITSKTNPWIVKIYVSINNELSVEKVFTSANVYDAHNAAESIAFSTERELFISCDKQEKLIFSRI